MSTSQPNLSKAERREAARAEAQALQQKQRAREKTARLLTLILVGALIILLGVAIWLILRENGKTEMEKVDTVPATVLNVDGEGSDVTGIPIGPEGQAGVQNEDAPRLDVFVDYMCPICGQFEQLNGESLDQLRGDGDVNLVVHPVAILDHLSKNTDYSSRAASAAAWVADRSPEHFEAFNDLLFQNQPAENTGGLSDQQMGELAKQAGVPDDIAEGITSGDADETFREWVTASTEWVKTQAYFGGTPTVLLDGERFDDWRTPGTLATAITG